MNKVLKTIWNLLKITMGLCVVCGSFYFGYNFFSSKFKNPEANYNYSFHNLPENSMDVIVLDEKSTFKYFEVHFYASFFMIVLVIIILRKG